MPSKSSSDSSDGTQAVNNRVSVYLSDTEVLVLDQLCRERGCGRSALLHEALGILQAIRDATREGYLVGATRDREMLHVLIAAP